LTLEISTGTPHHASFGDNDQQVTVFTGPERTGYSLPVVPRFRLSGDVPLWESYPAPIPLGPAQAGIEGDVFVPLPGPNPLGGGVIVEPLTAASFEFDAEEGYDNAALEALATPSTPPADIDLYLQRETEDGWEDVSAGTDDSTEQELLKAGRLEAGHYRIVVNNWIGGPQDVHLELTFFNQNGEPGEGATGTGTTGTAHVVTGGSYGLLQP
jgi:hypothetical protein